MGPKKKTTDNEKKSMAKAPAKETKAAKGVEVDETFDKAEEEEAERILQRLQSWTVQQRTYYSSREHHPMFWHVVLDWGFDPEDADEYLDEQ